MKQYGNMVKKYASGDVAGKYDNIIAESEAEFRKKQVADLERLKNDFSAPRHPDNQQHYDSLVDKQKKEIRNEIKRLNTQIEQEAKPKKEKPLPPPPVEKEKKPKKEKKNKKDK